jgi:hypothetical protein
MNPPEQHMFSITLGCVQGMHITSAVQYSLASSPAAANRNDLRESHFVNVIDCKKRYYCFLLSFRVLIQPASCRRPSRPL